MHHSLFISLVESIIGYYSLLTCHVIIASVSSDIIISKIVMFLFYHSFIINIFIIVSLLAGSLRVRFATVLVLVPSHTFPLLTHIYGMVNVCSTFTFKYSMAAAKAFKLAGMIMITCMFMFVSCMSICQLYNTIAKAADGKRAVIETLTGASSLGELETALAPIVGIPSGQQQISIGFPPKDIVMTDKSATLTSLAIKSGESLTVKKVASHNHACAIASIISCIISYMRYSWVQWWKWNKVTVMVRWCSPSVAIRVHSVRDPCLLITHVYSMRLRTYTIVYCPIIGSHCM